MAKFCANCGSKMEDGDKVCGQCGTPVAQSKTALSKPSGEKKNKGGRRTLKLLLTVGILAVIAAAAVGIAVKCTGYQSALDRMAKALQKNDMDTLEELASSINEGVYGFWYGDDLDDYYEDTVSDALDKFEDSVGAVKKITYEIIDEKELSSRKVEELEDALEKMYDLDVSGIKKIIKVELELTVKGAKESDTYYVDSLYLVKESGGWKLFYGSLSY